MKYDKKKAIDIIVKAATNYKNTLQDKAFLLIYQENGKMKTVQVEFRENHFLHLTGVQTSLSAKRFYEKCVSHKLSFADIFPVTLYKEDVRKLSQPTNKVLAIFVKDYKKHRYTECAYLSKGQKLDKLLVIEEIGALVQMDTESIDNGIKSK